LKAMLLTKLKTTLTVVLILGFVVTGATMFPAFSPAGMSGPHPAEEHPKVALRPDKEKEPFTAWGKEAGGLQAGLGFRPGEHRAYHLGETVTLVVRIRNVGKEAVKFEYLRQFLDESPPTVTGADGKTVPQHRTEVLGFHFPAEVTLEPGKEIELE